MKYGSTVNSLGNRTDSDLDLTLVIPDFEISHEIVLRSIKYILEVTES
jgi:hypothetical protein